MLCITIYGTWTPGDSTTQNCNMAPPCLMVGALTLDFLAPRASTGDVEDCEEDQGRLTNVWGTMMSTEKER
eukprot:2650879-Pyramimonas_sp.AAC.1